MIPSWFLDDPYMIPVWSLYDSYMIPLWSLHDPYMIPIWSLYDPYIRFAESVTQCRSRKLPNDNCLRFAGPPTLSQHLAPRSAGSGAMSVCLSVRLCVCLSVWDRENRWTSRWTNRAKDWWTEPNRAKDWWTEPNRASDRATQTKAFWEHFLGPPNRRCSLGGHRKAGISERSRRGPS